MDIPGDAARQPDPAMEQFLSEFRANLPRQLSEDLAALKRLGRGGATADPDLPPEHLVSEIRRQAGALTFESPVAAATAALRHAAELPHAERGVGEEPFGPYHASASSTVADGELVREWLGSDASIELVFQREADEANATAVLLQAVVRVAASGSVTLTSYGWPIRAVDRPWYRFDGAAEGYLRQMVGDLAAADQTPPAFERAMLMAYGVAVAQRRRAPLPDAVMQAVHQQVFGLVVERLPLLGRYLDQAINRTGQGGPSGWFAGCVSRSALESLFEGFLGGATFELIDQDAPTELAEAIGEAAESVPEPTRRALVPAGTPAGHTWWSDPASPGAALRDVAAHRVAHQRRAARQDQEEAPPPAAGSPAEPDPDAFQPANGVEAAMLEAVRKGDTDAYLKALILAELVVPAGTGHEPEPPRMRVSGRPAIPLFTSPERLAERYAGLPYDLVDAVTLMRDWPDPAVALTVNPGTAIGGFLPGPQVAELAAWAAGLGLVDIRAEGPPGGRPGNRAAGVSRRSRPGSPGTPGAPR